MSVFRFECAAFYVTIIRIVRIVVHNQSDIGRAVIVEWIGEIDSYPTLGRESDIAAKQHPISLSYRNPVGSTFKSRLVRMNHINVKVPGFGVGSRVKERHAGNLTRSSHFG